MSRYHKAAIDGYLDLLKEATKKDLNAPDEDGMTPTLWAAYHGHIEALQLICSRRGDPDKSDIWGNTALHHAATNGHLHIVKFLVNFGANLFSLDNDFHTAMDVAASGDRMDCVRFLDSAASQQTLQNPRKVKLLKEQATKEAERRVKMCEKVKRRHQNKMDKMYQSSASENDMASSSAGIASINEQTSKLSISDMSGSLTAKVKGTLQRKFGKKNKDDSERQGDYNVIFGKENGASEQPDAIAEEDEDGGTGTESKSIFNRPGLGNMVFRRNFSTEMGMEPDDLPSLNTEDIGSSIWEEVLQPEEWANEETEDGEMPWNEEDVGLDEEEEETSPLAAFLASLNLVEFAPIFTREQLDLEALMLCSDDDLKGIRIQLGPRKKILEAATCRKNAMQKPRAITDTVL
ncbi:ankyrin repeat and SAM domain-containing protein 4B [Arapaima gigas]